MNLVSNPYLGLFTIVFLNLGSHAQTCSFLSVCFCTADLSPVSFSNRSYPRNDFRNPLIFPSASQRISANSGSTIIIWAWISVRNTGKTCRYYAAADGYIYRIKIEPFGFGQAIYIRHHDGYVSLYAHLNAFYPALAAYVKQKQYELQRWDVSLDLPPGFLSVKKGELIAYSGNMGGSQGPHLHFEIRTFPEDTNLNPMLFGLPVKDNTPPVFRSLSVYDRNRSFYEQIHLFFRVKGTGGHYIIGLPILVLQNTQSGIRNIRIRYPVGFQ